VVGGVVLVDTSRDIAMSGWMAMVAAAGTTASDPTPIDARPSVAIATVNRSARIYVAP
jgi:hypothetical protein